MEGPNHAKINTIKEEMIKDYHIKQEVEYVEPDPKVIKKEDCRINNFNSLPQTFSNPLNTE